ncbi:MAG TPA: hypothetical protein DD727_02040 [Clostridiales bacterium]|nr:hypothetical protein [Clostridiales bacterium]
MDMEKVPGGGPGSGPGSGSMPPALPTVRLGTAEVSRLIIGGNPFSGNSHVNGEMDREMIDYFTLANIKHTLFRCMENGINTMLLRMDEHIMRMIHEFRAEGGRMHWIAQTAPEMGSLEGNIARAMRLKPVAIYHHGTITDHYYKRQEFGELRRRLEIIRKTGLPVGLGTHMPEVVRYAEENGLGADFYMLSVYNLSRADRVSSAVTGIANSNEPFFEEDIPVMYQTLRSVDKPCLAFKILGSTRRCSTQEAVRAAFDEAFASIKPTDAVVVGMFPRDLDQPALNSRYTREAIQKAADSRHASG